MLDVLSQNLPAIVTAVVGIAGIFAQIIMARLTRKGEIEKEMRAELATFYGPLKEIARPLKKYLEDNRGNLKECDLNSTREKRRLRVIASYCEEIRGLCDARYSALSFQGDLVDKTGKLNQWCREVICLNGKKPSARDLISDEEAIKLLEEIISLVEILGERLSKKKRRSGRFPGQERNKQGRKA